MILGKVIGTAIGYWLFGFLGAVLGFIGGSVFDRRRLLLLAYSRREQRLTPAQAEKVRQSFFTATFSIMGHVSKADGHVKQSEIAVAENVMERMGLTAELRALAIDLFNQGKHADFNLDQQIKQFREDCARSSSMYRVFLEIQIQAALADGTMASEEEAILLHVAKVLGFPEIIYRQLELLVRVSMGLGDNHGGRYQQRPPPTRNAKADIRDAYALLGVKPDDDKATVKRAYRKLMNQHHPDKLISKGLPEEMLKLATDKTQNIQKAYEQVKTARGW